MRSLCKNAAQADVYHGLAIVKSQPSALAADRKSVRLNFIFI